MPLYEYRCTGCRAEFERVLPVRLRKRPTSTLCEACGGVSRLMVSVPQPAKWSDDWRFPNLVKEGDGSASFTDKRAYEAHLKKEGIYELAGPGNPGKPRTRFRRVYTDARAEPCRVPRQVW